MSDEAPKVQPIIIKKKKSRHSGYHGGAWKVAYADFVTAMMAFFLVMWLVMQSSEVKQAVQGYFQDPIGFMNSDGKGMGVLEGGASPIDGRQQNPLDLAARLEQERLVLKDAGERIKNAIEHIPELSKLKEFIEIEMIPEGLRIQLIDADQENESNFFSLSSSALKPKGALLLEAISGELGNLENYIVIEGHTDSKPYFSRDGYSNWELSTDRANSARKLMEGSGLRMGQVVEVRGFADRLPRIEKAPEDPRNRRVSIIVLNEEAAEIYRQV